MTTPIAEKIYSGFVADVDRFGYHVNLIEFQETFQGFISKNSIEERLSDKLIRGRCVKVKVIAFSGDFLAISLVSVEEELIKMDGKSLSRFKPARTASPLRTEIKHYKPVKDDSFVTISIKREPKYYNDLANQMMNLKLGSSSSHISYNNNKFIFPKTFMFRNASQMSSQVLNNAGRFNMTSNLDSQWFRGNTLTNSQSSTSGKTSADYVELWLKEKSANIIKKQRELLPIFQFRDDLIRAVAENQFVIVQGETGSGENFTIRVKNYCNNFIASR